MSFFSKLFGISSPAERAAARREELMKVFPVLRKDAARAASSENERQTWENYVKEVPNPTANLEDKDEVTAKRIERLLSQASYSALKNPIAFEVISGELEKTGNSIRASGPERWDRIKQRVECLSGGQSAGIFQYYALLGNAPDSSLPEPEVEIPLEDKDDALAKKIKRLLLSASFHASRDPRAFKHLSGQLEGMGNSIRASGQERWDCIKRKVEFLSGDHFVGLSQYYDLLGNAPQASIPQPESEESYHASSEEPCIRDGYIGEEYHSPREAAVHAGLTVIEEYNSSGDVIALDGFGQKYTVSRTGNGPMSSAGGLASEEEMRKWKPQHRPSLPTIT
jgi:hypothetical protein